MDMQESRQGVGEAGGMAVLEVAYVDDRTRFREHPGELHAVWLQRAGAFLQRSAGVLSLVDPMSGIVVRRMEAREVAHPFGVGVAGTEIRIAAEQAERLPRGPFVASAELDVAHRSLLTACRSGVDGFELADRLHGLLRLVPEPLSQAGRHSPATRAAHQRLIREVSGLLAGGGLLLGLDALAQQVGYSPHHLSRVFHQVTGMTLTRYRNELRVRAVLEDLHEGERHLRTLAVRYGFADQAHLTRVMRRHRADTPSTLRERMCPDLPHMNVQRGPDPRNR